VLLHVEVQTQRDRTFARRMFIYNTRIADRFNRTTVSLAVLADDSPTWQPSGYRDSLWTWSVGMSFPVVKLLAYREREAELEADSNPFAKVVLAHLKALETRDDPETRRVWKFRLVRGLYERGFGEEDVRKLFRLIDWLMELPGALDNLFWDDVMAFQEERTVPFMTTPERIEYRKGMMRAIEELLRIRFQERGLALLPEITALYDADKYQSIIKVIATTDDVEEIRRACVAAAAPPPQPKQTRTKRPNTSP
jgi:hypothetical protein